MAVRAIDAVQVLHNINFHHIPTPVSEFESGFNDGLNQAMWEITNAPTLTQPNEPTYPCDLCVYNPPSSLGGKPCTFCPATGRPPEGEEEI